MNILKKSLVIGAAAAAIAFAGGAASAATDLGNLDVIDQGGGDYYVDFDMPAAVGDFDYIYHVSIPLTGFTSVQAGISGGLLTSATFNGQMLTPDGTGTGATFDFANLAAGTYDFELVGTGNKSGDLNGTISLIPSVPEPTSWAMMIGGVGFVGGALRGRGKREAANTATA